MNRILPPAIDDDALIDTVARNEALRAHPALTREVVAEIKAGYAQYRQSQGDCFLIDGVALPELIRDRLNDHFERPPADLRFIKTLREESESAACPMCGSLHSGSLDHLLPRSGFKEFSVFSMNLVPACKCNSKRGDIFKGADPNERILHPYFDDCLSDRLIRARFSQLGLLPKVEVALVVDQAHPKYAAIQFHASKIVRTSRATSYLLKQRWVPFIRQPSLVIRSLAANPHSLADLQNQLEQELEKLDACHEGRNNWNSMFVAGLLDQPVLQWLWAAFSVPGRRPDGALV